MNVNWRKLRNTVENQGKKKTCKRRKGQGMNVNCKTQELENKGNKNCEMMKGKGNGC